MNGPRRTAKRDTATVAGGEGSLPPILHPGRRGYFVLLIGVGLATTALTITTAVLLHLLITTPVQGTRLGTIWALAGTAAGHGALRLFERVTAEKMGQHYVQEIRVQLLEAALDQARAPSAGITIARITNDLSSIRNWITMGIAPVAVGVPLIAGIAVAVGVLVPQLLLAFVVPMLFLGLALAVMSKIAFSRARTVRRRRGRLASQVSDTVAAAFSIRAAGGSRREVERVRELGAQVADAAVSRAVISGAIRAVSAMAASGAVIAVAAVALVNGMSHAVIVVALAVTGLIGTHLRDVGRAVEYRQNYKAARRIIGPAMAKFGPSQAQRTSPVTAPETNSSNLPGIVILAGTDADPAQRIPLIRARPGDRVVLSSTDEGRVTEIFEELLGLKDGAVAAVVGGHHLPDQRPSRRRTLVGYAGRGRPLERGSITRCIRYRQPNLSADESTRAIGMVGLTQRVADLPKRERTVLKAGGSPLTVAQRARLQIGRALIGNPPLLLLDHIDADLGTDGTRLLAALLNDYQGVAIIASNNPEQLASNLIHWDISPLTDDAPPRERNDDANTPADQFPELIGGA